jgi:ParB family chromosome partitioning protein
MAKRELAAFVGGAGATAGGTVLRMMRTTDIQTDPELASLFHINEETLEEITQSMKESGYDRAEPLVLWRGRNTVVDGHTRLQAALAAGIFEVPVEEKSFEDMNEAQWYAFRRQADRRNLTQAEIYKAATELQAKLSRDGTGRAAELLAKRLNVSASTLEHARVVEARADEQTIAAVKSGDMSINQAYRQVRQRQETEDDEDLDAEERRYFEGSDDEEDESPPRVSAARSRPSSRQQAGRTEHANLPAGEPAEDDTDEEDDAEETRSYEEDTTDEENAEENFSFEEDTADSAEYTPPDIPFMEVIAFLLNLNSNEEKRVIEKLVDEFIPEKDRNEFWDLFPPNMNG